MQSYHKKILCASLLVLMPVTLLSAGEKIYIWKSKGVNVYSDIPPTDPNVGVTLFDQSLDAGTKQAVQENKLDSAPSNTENDNTESSDNDEDAAETRNCTQAKENLALVQEGGQDSSDRSSLINLYQQEVEQYCY